MQYLPWRRLMLRHLLATGRDILRAASSGRIAFKALRRAGNVNTNLKPEKKARISSKSHACPFSIGLLIGLLFMGLPRCRSVPGDMGKADMASAESIQRTALRLKNPSQALDSRVKIQVGLELLNSARLLGRDAENCWKFLGLVMVPWSQKKRPGAQTCGLTGAAQRRG